MNVANNLFLICLIFSIGFTLGCAWAASFRSQNSALDEETHL